MSDIYLILEAFLQAKLPHRDLPILALQFPEVHDDDEENIHVHLKEFFLACGVDESSIHFREWTTAPSFLVDEHDTGILLRPFLVIDQYIIDFNLRRNDIRCPFPFIQDLRTIDSDSELLHNHIPLAKSLIPEPPVESLMFYTYPERCTLFYNYAEIFDESLIYPKTHDKFPLFYRMYDLYKEVKSLRHKDQEEIPFKRIY